MELLFLGWAWMLALWFGVGDFQWFEADLGHGWFSLVRAGEATGGGKKMVGCRCLKLVIQGLVPRGCSGLWRSFQVMVLAVFV